MVPRNPLARWHQVESTERRSSREVRSLISSHFVLLVALCLPCLHPVRAASPPGRDGLTQAQVAGQARVDFVVKGFDV
jgi:hypothetical protein